ncbi:hypothetical protein [Haloarcula marina]|uniref:hypothetical protein n=1 Tax=Haloarcula marina TaxID=2961574 RepID=UPI0020B6F1CA|nr:hypothetical protein [Halomicroarcula marina]
MSGDRLTRRRLLLGATAATAALTGCLSGDGGSGETANNSGGTATTESQTATPAETSTPVTTTSDPTTTLDESAGVCAPWEGQTTSYDAAGTPFFCTYDYVAAWTPGESTSHSRGHFIRFTSPPVGDDDFALTLRVSQDNVPLTAAERDDEIEFLTNLDTEPREVVDEVTYDGESRPVLGLAEGTYPYYQPGLSVFLPYGSGSDRRYYGVGAVLFSGLGVSDEARPACIAAAEAAQSAVVQSLAPNPETTFEGA